MSLRAKTRGQDEDSRHTDAGHGVDVTNLIDEMNILQIRSWDNKGGRKDGPAMVLEMIHNLRNFEEKFSTLTIFLKGSSRYFQPKHSLDLSICQNAT